MVSALGSTLGAVLRVLVVDDDPMIRTYCGQILSAAGDIEVVGEASDGDEVVAAVHAHHPDVVVMDLTMRRMGGVAATAELHALPHPPRVLAVTAFDTPALILAAVDAGVDGFLAKDATGAEIVAAVRSVAAGDGAFSGRAQRIILERIRADRSGPSQQEARAMLAPLTDKELEVARAVGDGLTNAQIAARAYVSEATVKTHLGRALAKVGLTNRTQLAIVVDRAGLGRSNES